MRRSILVAGLISLFGAQAADQPQWGSAWDRNMVSRETGLPSSFDLQSGRNVKWVADLGTESHSTPVVSGGKVFIGTNNGQPRDPKHQGDRGVFMCFDEADGRLLWQLVVPKRDEDPYYDWPRSGISSPGTVEGKRVYLVSNRHEVMCLDVEGMANGNDGPFKDEGRHMTPKGTNAPPKALEPGPLDADIVWAYDMMAESGIWPHDGAHSSVLIHGDHLYVNTGTGVDNTHKKIRTPDAPSLLVFNKHTGQLLARDGLGIASNIFHATWSAPTLGQIEGKPVIFLPAGNGVIYGFEPLPTNFVAASSSQVRNLKKVYEFDFDPEAPKSDIHRFNGNRGEGPSNFYGVAVFHDEKLYAAGGGDVFWGKNWAYLKSISASRFGNATEGGEIWAYELEKHVLSSPAIHNDLIFIADTSRNIHCVSAKTGKANWVHGANGDFWSSPMVADGKVYIGSRRGDFWILKASDKLEVLFRHDFRVPISATTTIANGALYIATMDKLHVIQEGARPKASTAF